MTAWRAVLRHPLSGEELSLEGWTNIQITENFEGASATIEMPGERPELSFVTELVTNVLLYSDRVLAYQMRIMDAEDTFTENGHTVSLSANSYESILTRRVLFEDYDQPATDQHEIAWWFINYTQGFEDLGITKALNWAEAGVDQDRIIQKGKTIVEAINEAASVPDGFDWWVDQNLKFHTQTPKKVFDTGLDLTWGAMVNTVTRSSASDTYDSVVYVTGATNETQIEGGATYPPPPPALRQLSVRPYGRWERAWTYGDLITAASVEAKADWHLAESSAKKATYRLGLRHGVWNQTLRPGGLLSLRVKLLPRLDFRVQCRIEEISLGIGPNGEEAVELGTRGEAFEAATPTLFSDIGISALASPAGAIDVTPTEATGRSQTVARVSEMDMFAAMLRRFEERISRSELH